MIAELPLFIFTTFAGLAAGIYVAFTVFGNASETARANGLKIAALCLVLLVVGLLGCMGHLKRPERFLNALANPSAGIAQEAYLCIVFGLVLLADCVISKKKGAVPAALRVVGCIAAVLLACVMGFAYFISLGVPAWCHWSTIALFLVGDLLLGVGAYLLLEKQQLGCKTYGVVGVVLAVLFALVAVMVGVRYLGLGLGTGYAEFAAAVASVAGGAALIAASKNQASWGPVAVAVLCIAAVVIARYAFYASAVL